MRMVEAPMLLPRGALRPQHDRGSAQVEAPSGRGGTAAGNIVTAPLGCWNATLESVPARCHDRRMTPDEARLLLEYHVWARERALAAVAMLTPEQFVRDLGSSFGSVRDTLAHLCGADEVWFARWNGSSPTGLPPPDRFPDVAALRAAWAALDPQLRAFVAALDAEGLARKLTYRAFNGQQATLAYWQMLQHLVNHGSYHRGQITTLLRQLGAPAPQGMDLVAFYRERSG
jgi:uncharacterized damage-inducible protein DinB